MNAPTLIPVTRYHRPNGRREETSVPFYDASDTTHAEFLLSKGYSFTAEDLGAGITSWCIVNPEQDQDVSIAFTTRSLKPFFSDIRRISMIVGMFGEGSSEQVESKEVQKHEQ